MDAVRLAATPLTRRCVRFFVTIALLAQVMVFGLWQGGCANPLPPEPEPPPPPVTAAACVPSCDGRSCGDDGCGGSCGTCGDDAICWSGACRLPCEPGESCDDGDPCTSADHCVEGLCFGDVIPCDDGDPCTDDRCADGECHFEVSNAPCDDGIPCTGDDRCTAQGCVGQPLGCEDGNPCTDDVCTPSGCAFVANAVTCDDGSWCTAADRCIAGNCVGVPRTCDDGIVCTLDLCTESGCVHAPSDGMACAGDDPCAPGVCHGSTCEGAGTPDCDDGNPCTDDVCTDVGCVSTPREGNCDDGNACTWGEQCISGVCFGGIPVNCGAHDCGVTTCDPVMGCVVTASEGPCDDANPCTTDDTCVKGSCVGEFVDCDDGNVCTVDHCTDVGCTSSVAALGTFCDDGDPCTMNEVCFGGACGLGLAVACDDFQACTIDVCDPVLGCLHTLDDGPCDDGSACTEADRCTEWGCRGMPRDCSGSEQCVAYGCDNLLGCTQTPLHEVPCNDSDACTIVDRCVAGVCEGSGALPCADGACTTVTCLPDVGCYYTPVSDGAACDDGNPCSDLDACAGGACLGVQQLPCDDGNPCTIDGCEDFVGCTAWSGDGFPCDDGNACTAADECTDGNCVGTAATSCDDQNPCTVDACDPELGCSSLPNDGAACDDGDACTTDEHCAPGGCVGTPVLCDDGNPCTHDVCDSGAGCLSEAAAGACDDGNPCTSADECQQGVCVGGPPPAELCNGQDDDCDDQIDEGCPCPHVDTYRTVAGVAVGGGGTAVVVDAPADGPSLDGDFSGAAWIWASEPTDAVQQFVWLVSLPEDAAIADATLQFWSAGVTQVFVEQNLVGSGAELETVDTVLVDLTPWLGAGEQVLTIETSGGALAASLEVSYSAVDSAGCK